ncbi:MAG: PHP domain-containing protein [bacterium]|nr:PHP domain-containing protein [bacterium]
MPDNFVHLHCHSDYSTYDGFQKVEEIAKRAKELDFPAIALTDHGKAGGFIKFYKACKKENIKSILGEEIYLVDDITKKDSKRYHLTVLAKNIDGYKNLLRLSTISHQHLYRGYPRLDLNLLKQYSSGIVILSGCVIGELSSMIVADQNDNALRLAKTYKEIWGDDYYLEIMWTKHQPQLKAMKGIFEIAKKLDIKIVSTNDCVGPDTIIFCKNGAKKIKDIRVGDPVLTHTGQYKNVEVVCEKITLKKKYKITIRNEDSLRNIPNKLIITEDHQVYVFDSIKNEFYWTNVDSLNQEYHHMFIPFEQHEADGDIKSINIAEDHESDNIKVEMDEDWFYIFGIFSGDGCAHQNSNLISFCVSPDNIFLQKILEEKFRSYGKFTINNKHKLIVYRMTNRYWSRFFKKYFYNKNKNKTIPEFILKSSQLRQSAFMCGLIDSDGHIYKDGKRFSFHNTSLDLVDFVRKIFSKNNIHCLLSRCKNARIKFRGGWVGYEKEQYTWYCYGDQIKQAIDFLSLYKVYELNVPRNIKRSASRIIHKNGILVKFKKSECYTDNEPVWDIQVAGNHSFCTNFGIVHNCHYSKKSDGYFQKIKISISRNAPLKSEDWKTSDEYYIKSFDEMRSIFKGDKEQFLYNTVEIADKCDVDIKLGQVYLPDFDVPKDDFKFNMYKIDKHRKTEEEMYLSYLAENGLKKIGKWDNSEYKERLFKELETIKFTGFTRYFLIVNEFIQTVVNTDSDLGFGIKLKRGLGRGCFTKENIVLTSSGKKHIHKIKIGDMVLSHDGRYHRVRDVHKYTINEDLIEIQMGDKRKITCTSDHKILINRNSKRIWVMAKNLTINDDIIDIKKYQRRTMAKIISIKRKRFKGDVYDLSVEGSHTYNIDGLAVHNSACGSLVLYCLGVIGVDPIKYNLSMDRFLYMEANYKAGIEDFFSMQKFEDDNIIKKDPSCISVDSQSGTVGIHNPNLVK